MNRKDRVKTYFDLVLVFAAAAFGLLIALAGAVFGSLFEMYPVLVWVGLLGVFVLIFLLWKYGKEAIGLLESELRSK